MSFLLKRVSATVAMSFAALPAMADPHPWRTTQGDERVFQALDWDETLLCRPGGFAGIECTLTESKIENDILRFQVRPFDYELVSNAMLSLTNTIRETQEFVPVEAIDGGLSAAKFVGKWADRDLSYFQIVSFDAATGRGILEYGYLDEVSRMPFQSSGQVMFVDLPNGINFYFMQLDGEAYGMYLPNGGGAAFAIMKEEPYEFPSAAHCAQAHLNFLGFDVGKADGQPGQKSLSGSEAFLAANPEVDLTPLTGQTAGDWCDALSARVDVAAGVIAMAGF